MWRLWLTHGSAHHAAVLVMRRHVVWRHLLLLLLPVHGIAHAVGRGSARSRPAVVSLGARTAVQLLLLWRHGTASASHHLIGIVHGLAVLRVHRSELHLLLVHVVHLLLCGPVHEMGRRRAVRHLLLLLLLLLLPHLHFHFLLAVEWRLLLLLMLLLLLLLLLFAGFSGAVPVFAAVAFGGSGGRWLRQCGRGLLLLLLHLGHLLLLLLLKRVVHHHHLLLGRLAGHVVVIDGRAVAAYFRFNINKTNSINLHSFSFSFVIKSIK